MTSGSAWGYMRQDRTDQTALSTYSDNHRRNSEPISHKTQFFNELLDQMCGAGSISVIKDHGAIVLTATFCSLHR